jgi:hypothetical protein
MLRNAAVPRSIWGHCNSVSMKCSTSIDRKIAQKELESAQKELKGSCKNNEAWHWL